jgi:hypothetical protein
MIGRSKRCGSGPRVAEPSCEGIDTARLYRETRAALQKIEAGAPLSAYPQIHTATAAVYNEPGIDTSV